MNANLTASEANAIVREGFKRDGVKLATIVPASLAILFVACFTAVLLWCVVWVCARCVVALTGNAWASVVQAAAQARLADPRSLFLHVAADFNRFVVPLILVATVVTMIHCVYSLVVMIFDAGM